MWVGSHHLHWTAIPDWTSSLAAAFSILLLMPSWGGMINGIMTLSGAWDKLRSDPIMLFLITSLSFYGMSTFEGPLMALKSVNALSHYTDWTIGHVHSGALGWVAMVSFGSFYHMIPRLYDTKLYSQKLVYVHFFLATIGIILYIVALWVAGIGQGIMLRAFDDFGNLQYTFVESVAFMHWPYVIRTLGGALFVVGVMVMAFNVFMTITQAKREATALEAKIAAKMAGASGMIKHESIETNVGLLIILSLVAMSIGGLVEIVPLFYINDTIEKVDGVRPYSPLELRGSRYLSP